MLLLLLVFSTVFTVHLTINSVGLYADFVIVFQERKTNFDIKSGSSHSNGAKCYPLGKSLSSG